MMLALSLLLPVLVLLLLPPQKSGQKMGVTVAAGLFVSFLIIISLARAMPVVEEYSWLKSIGVDFNLRLDKLSVVFAALFFLVSSLCSLFSTRYVKKNFKWYYICITLFAVSMVGLVLSTNFIQFCIFWEAMVIPSYFLIAYWGESKNKEWIGLKFFIFMHISALLLLISTVWLHSLSGSFSFEQVSNLKSVPQAIPILIFICFAIKMAVVPLHNWLPSAHSEAPSPVSSMLSGLMVKVGVYGIFKMLFEMGLLKTQISGYVSVLAILTMFFGALMALVQDDIKRLLAYSTISQIGYLTLAPSAGMPGFFGAAMHVLNHGVAKALLFLCAGSIIVQTKERSLSKMGGLLKKMPITSACIIIGALSLAGVPPLGGFFSELLIFTSTIKTEPLLTGLAVFGGVLTLSYFLLLMNKALFGKAPKNLKKAKEAPIAFLIPQIVLAVIVILLGLFPDAVLKVIS